MNVCLRHLDDVQLAVALARVVEGRDDGPVLRNILYETIIPLAFKKGNRWLGSWAFWLLNRRDLAVRILVVSNPSISRGALSLTANRQTPLQDVASALDIPIKEFGNPHYDDPSLALLFSQLKSKTLQTAKGTSDISGNAEFNFVLQIARVFIRMGERPFSQPSTPLFIGFTPSNRVPRTRIGPRQDMVVRSAIR